MGENKAEIATNTANIANLIKATDNLFKITAEHSVQIIELGAKQNVYGKLALWIAPLITAAITTLLVYGLSAWMQDQRIAHLLHSIS